MSGCHCLCARNHPREPGICRGRATTKLLLSDGRTAVLLDVCGACRWATWEERKRR